MNAVLDDLIDRSLKLPKNQGRFLNKAVFRKPQEPQWTSENDIALETPISRLRVFKSEGHLDGSTPSPVLVVPPEVNQSFIVDFDEGQSLVATLADAEFPGVAALEWRSPSKTTAQRDIDDSIMAILNCIEHLGGKVHLVGLCQGGWESAIAAALEPERVASLTLVAAPIDFAVGEGFIRHLAQSTPMVAYRAFVARGGGQMPGQLISRGFDSLMPFQRYWLKYLSLWNNIDDEIWLHRYQRLDDWYRYHKDLPGPLYLRAVRELFKENRLVQGRFVSLGRVVDLSRIDCPLCMVTGLKDHITPEPQVLAAEKHMSSTETLHVKTPGGHIGAFMGREELKTYWPPIAQWLLEHEAKG